jgi:hypothetical protein
VGFKTWVVGEEVLAADFNDYVQEQVVATFANAAARTSAMPAPNVGSLTFLADSRVYQWWNGTNWMPLLGVLSYVENIGPQTGISTAITDLTGLITPPIPMPAGHRVEVSAEVTFTKAGPDTASWVELHLADGGNADFQVRFSSCPAPGWVAMTATRVLTTVAGSYQFKARAATGAGFVNTQAAPNAPSWIMVKDLGAV